MLGVFSFQLFTFQPSAFLRSVFNINLKSFLYRSLIQRFFQVNFHKLDSSWDNFADITQIGMIIVRYISVY